MIDVENLHPHIVREYNIGHTRIQIADNSYRDSSPEDFDRILKRISQIATQSIKEVDKIEG